MFTRVLTACVAADWTRLTLPGRHWKWRMRGSAAHLASAHADTLGREYDLLFASSYLPLAELRGLVPSLSGTPSVLYFHENQLAFPWKEPPRERDFHYGFTQIVSALAATCCVFNSAYNRDSFLGEGEALLARMPDARMPEWSASVRAKSAVLGVPLDPDLDAVRGGSKPTEPAAGPLIVWNHRWEHDKNPEAFFAVMQALADRAVPFRLAVCGRRFGREPDVFEQARASLRSRIEHWGPLESRGDYLALLGRSDVAVSTARHEFFGVSMLEAAHLGAHVLVPRRLAYPEHFGEEFSYEDDVELERRLEHMCRAHVEGETLRADRRHLTAPYRADALGPRYEALFAELSRG